jgi:hypothetical protein
MKIVGDHDPRWSVRSAIEAQIRKEDMIAWAQSPTPEFQVIPPLPPAPQWRPSVVRAFISSIIA